MSERVYRQLLARVGEQHPRPRLEPTRRLVDLLGNPQDAAPVIHLTGTNGKTSTSRMIESLLRAAGLRTGMLTSPHLERFNERIVIDGEPISDEQLDRNWEEIGPYLSLVDDELERAGESPLTFFEALTGLAFVCFADTPVDVVVLEVGMGGEWDSTNVATADVAVFTPIALDHLGRIGNTLGEIAQTKAGILKPGCVAVSAQQLPEVATILRERSADLHAAISFADTDFALERSVVAVGGQLIDVRGRAGQYPELLLPLFGAHQAHNAALAIAAVESFLGDGAHPLPEGIAQEGLAEVRSPGRLEPIGSGPLVVVDGAHNPHGVRALCAGITESFPVTELAIVLGVLAEKDVAGILAELRELRPARMFATQSESERSVPAEDLAELASASGFVTEALANSASAFDAARAWAGESEGRAVLVTGSLTLVAEARRAARIGEWLSR